MANPNASLPLTGGANVSQQLLAMLLSQQGQGQATPGTGGLPQSPPAPAPTIAFTGGGQEALQLGPELQRPNLAAAAAQLTGPKRCGRRTDREKGCSGSRMSLIRL